MQERLQKIISASGLMSRRAAEECIKVGRVSVNGVAAALGMSADTETDNILVDGRPLPTAGEKLYIMLNKPKGYVTTLHDEKDRRCVTELLSGLHARVYPVGRLDMYSEGLLICTNDGEFANRLMHPSHEVEKCYLTWVQGEDVGEAVEYLRYPMEIDGYMTRGAEVDIISLLPGGAFVTNLKNVLADANIPVLTGIRVQFQGDKVIMSSTDRFRLARSSFTWTPEDATISTTALVRGSLLRDMARSLDEHQNVTIDFDADNPSLLGFENAGRVSTSQLIDGEFPAVDRLYADEYPIHAVINKQALIDAIKRVSLVAERNAPIRMVFSGQELTLSAGTADEAQAKEILDIDMDGEDITVAFNPSYLVDGLSAISEPFVRMKMTTAVKPVEFNGQQEADSDESMDYRYLLVPMRFNN